VALRDLIPALNGQLSSGFIMSNDVTINVHEASFHVLYRHFYGGTEEETSSKLIDGPIFKSAFFLVAMKTAVHTSIIYGISMRFRTAWQMWQS
jgi:hypothetical protein